MFSFLFYSASFFLRLIASSEPPSGGCSTESSPCSTVLDVVLAQVVHGNEVLRDKNPLFEMDKFSFAASQKIVMLMTVCLVMGICFYRRGIEEPTSSPDESSSRTSVPLLAMIQSHFDAMRGLGEKNLKMPEEDEADALLAERKPKDIKWSRTSKKSKNMTTILYLTMITLSAMSLKLIPSNHFMDD